MTIAKYLRLSAEDEELGQAGKAESDSIVNQRNLLDAFIGGKEDFIGADVLEFCDDGWSGKNFDRPAVKELLEQTKRGKIQCIIVKDMSRFGRDYLTVGNYISKVFPFLGVRFIAVNDGLDSIRPGDIDSLDTSFRALLYDLYSRDLSRKVRSAKRLRAQKGEWVASRPPYGYGRDSEKKNHLVIDPPAAGVVRRIFQLVDSGNPLEKVAQRLNLEGVPTPMQYKTTKGRYTSWHSVHEENFWTSAAVLRIIRDEQYLGKVVYGKRFYDVIGSTHSVKVSKEDWIVVESRHEAIVTQAEYDCAQATLQEYKERKTQPASKPLCGKIRCGVCGHALYRRDTKNPYYFCRTPGVTDKFPCPKERIAEQEIHAALLDSLRSMAQMAVNMEKLLKGQQNVNTRDIAAMRRSLTSLQGQLSQMKQQMKGQYEAFVLEELSKAEYLAEKAVLLQKEEALSAQISKLEASIEKAHLGDSRENALAGKLRQYVDVDIITEDVLDSLLAQVSVFPGGRLEIQWQFQDEFEALRRLVESE